MTTQAYLHTPDLEPLRAYLDAPLGKAADRLRERAWAIIMRHAHFPPSPVHSATIRSWL